MKLHAHDILNIISDLKSGITQHYAATKYGVSQSRISQIWKLYKATLAASTKVEQEYTSDGHPITSPATVAPTVMPRPPAGWGPVVGATYSIPKSSLGVFGKAGA